MVLQKEKYLFQKKEDKELQESQILVVVLPFLQMKKAWQEIDFLKECLIELMKESNKRLWKELKEIT